jgi:serine-type D-Ala-D-Ala carboxypeptidase/endopeptidase (penicillin-binding protein 4)
MRSFPFRRLAAAATCALALVLYAWPVAVGAGLQDGHTAVERLRQDLTAYTRLQGVRRGSWGIVVHSLSRDERLVELNPESLLIPASAVKLISAASAAEAVGWDYRFTTTLRATGPIVNGVLRGDLIVVGSGDPSIGGRGGDPLADLVAPLQARGVTRIEGRIIGDDDALEEPRPALAWAWDDLGYATGAIFGALNLNENRMTVSVSAGATEGGPTTVRAGPEATHRPLANHVVTGPRSSAVRLWPEQRPGEELLTIAGSIPAGSRPVMLTVSAGNPTLWFASAFRHLLMQTGIDVTGGAYDVDSLEPQPDTASATVLFTYTSPPLRTLVQPLLKDSVNLYGEAFLRLNAAPGVLPTNDAALEGLAPRLAAWGLPDDARQIVDGSGLSRRNLISPDALLRLLQQMYDPTGRSPFMAGLPVAAVDGTLASRLRGTAAAGTVRAKTGTMTTVRALAGYATTRDGEPLAFAILLNNFEGTGASATQAVDAITTRLANFTRTPPAGSR